MKNILRLIEKFFVSIGYISTVNNSYTYKNKKAQKFFDSPDIVYKSYPKKKEIFRRIFLFIAGFIIFILLISLLLIFLFSYIG